MSLATPSLRLSNGHVFTFLAASGALGFDARGWPWEKPLGWLGLLRPEFFTVVLKTLTLEPQTGNGRGPGLLKLLPGGMVNAIGLRNPGLKIWLKNYLPRLPSSVPIIISLAGTDDDLVKMAGQLSAVLPKVDKKIVGLEINLSCPNAKLKPRDSFAALWRIKEITNLPLIVKLGYDPNQKYLEEAEALAGRAEAVNINSVLWHYAFPNQTSPLVKFGGGGVSGQIAQPFNWPMVQELSAVLPVIGPSVWEYTDIAKLFSLGAKAIAFGSIFVKRPWAPTRYIRRWHKNHNTQ